MADTSSRTTPAHTPPQPQGPGCSCLNRHARRSPSTPWASKRLLRRPSCRDPNPYAVWSAKGTILCCDTRIRANVDPRAAQRAREAAGYAAADEPSGAVPAAEDASERDRFRHWMLADDDPSLRSTLHHLGTFWDARESSNVILVHYDDLKADLPGEMRRLAQWLDIAVPESAWASLERAATFEDMRQQGRRLVPESSRGIWRDERRFFNRGESGQWENVLEDADQREYAARVAELAAPDLLGWVHREPVTVA
jgi:hypothetical protein